jgi:hypothetical protein
MSAAGTPVTSSATDGLHRRHCSATRSKAGWHVTGRSSCRPRTCRTARGATRPRRSVRARVVDDRTRDRLIPRDVVTGVAPGTARSPAAAGRCRRGPAEGRWSSGGRSPVEPAALDHHVRERRRQRGVGSRSHPQPVVGLLRKAGAPRVDDDEAGAAGERGDRARRVREPRDRRVVAPEQDAAGVVEVGHVHARHGGAVGVDGGEVATPAAQLHVHAQVRAAERTPQPLHPVDGVAHRRGRGRGGAEHDGLGPVGPARARPVARRRCPSASSHVMRCQPGSPAPLGVVRCSG